MKKIILATAGFHFFLLLLMLLSYRPQKKVEPETLLVQTVQLQSPPPKPKPVLKPKPVTRPKPVSKPKPVAQPKPKTVARKKAPPPPPKKETKQIFDNLEKSLAKLESKTKPLPTPKKLEVIKAKPTLKEVLIATLQRELILPEMGKVQVRLAVDGSGKISVVEFLAVESEVNRKYIEEKLSSVTLPAFEKRDDSYILTFTNRNTS